MILKPRKPEFKGMTVLRVGYINIADIEDRKITNIARAGGLLGVPVTKFEKLIKNGTYEPWHNIPPVVIKLPNGMYELVAGDHRLQAHIGQKKTEFWVAVVVFDSKSNQLYYQSVENKNDLSYVATPRTLDDIVNSAIHILKECGYVDGKFPTSNYVWTVVNQLQISTEEASKTSVHSLIRKKIGSTTKDVKGYDAKGAARKANEIHTNSGNSSISMSAEMYKNVSGVTGDTDLRLFAKIFADKEQNGAASPYWVYGHWSGLDGEKIPKARINKQQHWTKVENMIRGWAIILNSKEYVSPILKPLPQLSDEYND